MYDDVNLTPCFPFLWHQSSSSLFFEIFIYLLIVIIAGIHTGFFHRGGGEAQALASNVISNAFVCC